MQNEPIRLSIGQAAEYLGISIDTLRRWEKKGRIIPYRSPGGHRYFDKEDLNKLFDKRYTREPKRQFETKTESIKEHITTPSPYQSTSQPQPEPVDAPPLVQSVPLRPIPQIEIVKTSVASPPESTPQQPLNDEQRNRLSDILETKTPERETAKKTKKMSRSQKIGVATIIIFIVIDIIILYLYFSTKRSLLSPVP